MNIAIQTIILCCELCDKLDSCFTKGSDEFISEGCNSMEEFGLLVECFPDKGFFLAFIDVHVHLMKLLPEPGDKVVRQVNDKIIDDACLDRQNILHL